MILVKFKLNSKLNDSKHINSIFLHVRHWLTTILSLYIKKSRTFFTNLVKLTHEW